MVVGLAMTTTIEPASGRTVGGKEVGEGPYNNPMLRTLAPRPMGR